MPVLRRRFQKFDENVADNILPETKKTPATTIGNKKSSRDPSFRLLLETPSASQQQSSFAEWNAFEKDTKEAEDQGVKGDSDCSWPDIHHHHDDLAQSTSQDSQKENKKTKIRPLKANRLDDIRHYRAKEVLSEVKKDTKECAFNSPTDKVNKTPSNLSNHVSLEEEKGSEESKVIITEDSVDWMPFDAGFPDNVLESDANDDQKISTWECFGSILTTTSGVTSLEEQRNVKAEVTHGSSDVSMPANLNIENVLEQAEESWEHASQSDIISVEEDHEDAKPKIFMSLKCDTDCEQKPEEEEQIPISPPMTTADDSETFSLGLEMIQDTNSRRTSGRSANSYLLRHEGQELLSPAATPAITPTSTLIEVPPCATENTKRYERRLSSTEEKTKRYERILPMERIVETDEIVGHDKSFMPIQKQTDTADPASDKKTSRPMHEQQQTADMENNHAPLAIKVAHRKAFFHSARKRIQKKRSIHFPTRQSPATHTSSLLDTESEVSDCVSSDSASEHEGTMNIIIDTSSFHSGDVSAMTYPRDPKQCDESCAESSRYNIESKELFDRTSKSLSEEDVYKNSKYPKKTKAKPLGASTQEIEMLNTFLSAAGPKLHSSNLSMDEREEIHNRATKAGLPEDFVNKILDQTAGIVRWEEQSVGTLLTSASTETSSRSKHSVFSSGSHSTRYTKDDESISYDSFREMKSSSVDTDEGGYGCFQDLKSSFWLESGLSGDDMVENVTAAFSESFDEISRCRQPRRKRKTQVRV